MEIRSVSSCFQVLSYVLFFNTFETIFFCDIFISPAIKNFLGLCSQKQRKDFWVAYEEKQNCMITAECCLNMHIYFDNSVFPVSSIMPFNLSALFLVFWKAWNTNYIYFINLWKYPTFCTYSIWFPWYERGFVLLEQQVIKNFSEKS